MNKSCNELPDENFPIINLVIFDRNITGENSQQINLVMILSRKKKQHKHNFFGPDFPRTFLTLTPGCPGVKKFLLPSPGPQKNALFGRPRFSTRTSMTRRVLEKLCTKKVCVDFLVPILVTIVDFSSCFCISKPNRSSNWKAPPELSARKSPFF